MNWKTRVGAAAFRIAVVATILPWTIASAAPHRPIDDALILERMPRELGAEARQLRARRDALARAPRQWVVACALARRYIALGRAEADPRYYGYAEAALQPWQRDPRPPAEVRVLRAIIHQYRHAFDRALEDLDAALEAEPRHAQAWLSRATILRVTGRYAEAQAGCRPLISLVDSVIAATCEAAAASLRGAAAASYGRLDRLVRLVPPGDVAVRQWSLTVLAEIAERLGDPVAAERHLRAAIALARRDLGLRLALADLLLGAGRAPEVLVLLAEDAAADGALLRLALAARAAGDSRRFRSWRDLLAARFAASRARGEALHQAEEARFRLHAYDDAQGALRLALANWSRQREPRDARLVLEAALAARAPSAAAPVIAFVQAHGLEDVAIGRLRAALAGGG